ncbi:tRNA 2'-phosphotransferase 1 isoform X2 [Spodoptera frugiperda]|uniref:2'-phosphotransferase n=1 Tax=Spodoptera frugiperda TaxID=7108 RepID=A0A9R0DN32_SPOFR|nr:tRNA 2'-phosphotransferase 1 isoform X1 [Spodoptera frugiperda]XP_050550129.1 tRNA 2'-phosphotransferase 1 isoform X2 [Spodoptera frugiperda]
MNNKDIQLSKSLSWLLRHGAVKEGFKLSPEGYLEVNKILLHKIFRGKYNTSDIERVVNNNDKKRFKLRRNLSTNCLEIKANQGHTISEVTDADLTPITQPKYGTVIHGTYLKCWPAIKNEGLSRMKRKHIHLAKGTLDDASVISGLRRDTEVHIYINLSRALADGISFFESENGVILTSGNKQGYLEPKYFEKAINIRTGESLYP